MDNENIREYQPIDSYGVIGDCRALLLIAPDGAMDWGRLPNFDSPAIFCRLLDARRGGYFQIAPTDRTITGSQHYLYYSSVLRTTFAAEMGKIALTDFMPVEMPEDQTDDAADKSNAGSHHRVVRQVACLEGEMPITMTLKVTPNFGYAPCTAFLTKNNMENTTGAVLSGNDQHVGLFVAGEHCVTAFTIHLHEDGLHPTISAQVVLHEGERIQFILSTANSLSAAYRLVETDLPRRNFDWELAQTLSSWRKWATTSYHHPCQERGDIEVVAPLSIEKTMRRPARPERYGPNCRKRRAGYPATRREHR